MLARDLHEDNRRSWNSATKAHNSHKGDQAAFLRSGGTTLFPEELELLGDIAGRRLVHLQCNAAQDTLSLAAAGADVTGVDISDEAISFATKLSEDSGIPATFVRSDVFDWLERTDSGRFDIAFSSYGAVNWLSDLTPWAAGIAKVLRPGGRFVVVEFHPIYGMINDDWQLADDYWMTGSEPVTWNDGVGDYVAESRNGLVPWGYEEGMAEVPDPAPCHMFSWGMSDVIGALLAAGLRLDVFREYPYSNGFAHGGNVLELPGRRFVPPADVPKFPLMYGIAVSRPA
ncbi:MAG TPA: class I SAM-dependent methyltransferase [Pseudonocardiaceae bacterium]|jgi:SAM-dependent methyltransferase|nr:class I SAM-dependent methyltransferase [Pseudonocardiaceae bacterium]